MALSEKEKDWLERRKKNEKEYGSVYCPCCEQFNPEWDLYLGYCNDSTDCALTEHDFRDAAEFEARVAEKLAKPRSELRPHCSRYETTDDGHLVRKTACPPHHDIDKCAGGAACFLYLARLAVEAEMDRKS